MGKSNGDKGQSLQIVRNFDADPETVYRAWTIPSVMMKWFAPIELSTPFAEVDLKVGGKYRIGMKAADGTLHVATGTYREIIPDEKLALTWQWECSPSEPETLVTVEFKKSGMRTELLLTHEHFATEEAADDHRNGWGSALTKLAELVTAESGG